MGKKNLDKLFQEKFKNFSEVPEDKVWERISASLHAKQKKRRIIPFWLKLGGVAALLAVAIYVIDPFDNTEDRLPKVTDIEQPQKNDPIKEGNRSTLPTDAETKAEDTVVDIDPEDKNEVDDIPGKKASPRTTVVSEGQTSKVVQNDSKITLTKKNDPAQKQLNEALTSDSKPTIASQNSTDGSKSVEKLDSNNDKALKNGLRDNLTKASEDGIAKVDKETLDEGEEKPGGKSIFDEIKEQDTEDQMASNDATAKWSIGANVAPVYFNSIGEGSPIHSNFVANSKSGDVNLSYGLTVAYAISEKLSIRSGINKVDYGYDTNDVEFSPSLDASNAIEFAGGNGQFENIDYRANSESLVVEGMDGFSALDKKAAPELTGKGPARTGVMGQQFGYLEVPVELSYALVDNRFGVNLVGGFSSLFLVDNSVILSSGELTTEIGEANNLNSINFSGNIGFGVNYKFTPKVQLNIEPVFKYQLNTFSNTAGEFQPFSVGVYSGLNFRF